MPGLPTNFMLPAKMTKMPGGKERVSVDTSELEQILAQVRILADKGVGGSTPIGGSIVYRGSTAPNGWAFEDGSSYSKTTYPEAFAVIGYTYGGSGDNFNVPDTRGRVSVGLDNMGGTSANRITDAAADTLGGTGGVEEVTLTGQQSGIQQHNHTASITPDPHAHAADFSAVDAVGGDLVLAAGDNVVGNAVGPWTETGFAKFESMGIVIDNISNQTAAEAHTNKQPYIAGPMIIRMV